MPFIPHTADDTAAMLQAINVQSIENLFDEIPAELRCGSLTGVPDAVSEFEATRLMNAFAEQDRVALNFMGAGAYEHHIPAAVWEITTRGEFYSSYTPYQAEASQGTLQLIYEYQTMMASLTGMEVTNASLYDGASALAEAILMAVRANRASKSRRILIPRTVHPHYAAVAKSITASQGVELIELPFDPASGRTDLSSLSDYSDTDITAVVVPQPNVFGTLEAVDELTDWADEQGALAIAVVNPTVLGLLKPPGEWGRDGAAIVCGEGQPLGVPLSSGGPYFGFLACKQAHIRQLPGRLVGRTRDMEGAPGFTLTLQAREQHIRRSRATSNICTNQGLMVTAATIYLSLMGPEGLRRVAAECVAKTNSLVAAATAIDGVELRFRAPRFHEAVLQLPVSVAEIIERMQRHDVSAGVRLSSWYPELSRCLLVCVTETKSAGDIEAFVDALRAEIEEVEVAR
ncbi:MAG: aminomethyl-transferring glycine dehydrogenase subunit GcvPA [Candidatus Rariloculaceae bacterium]